MHEFAHLLVLGRHAFSQIGQLIEPSAKLEPEVAERVVRPGNLNRKYLHTLFMKLVAKASMALEVAHKSSLQNPFLVLLAEELLVDVLDDAFVEIESLCVIYHIFDEDFVG